MPALVAANMAPSVWNIGDTESAVIAGDTRPFTVIFASRHIGVRMPSRVSQALGRGCSTRPSRPTIIRSGSPGGNAMGSVGAVPRSRSHGIHVAPPSAECQTVTEDSPYTAPTYSVRLSVPLDEQTRATMRAPANGILIVCQWVPPSSDLIRYPSG